jgi:hypothetical protein
LKAAASAQEKVAAQDNTQTPNQRSNAKHKEPRLKVATFTKAKVAT